jgi:cytochrome c-type biogenesis protein
VGGLFLGGSLTAAFLAGVIALFAPCCIVFLFPSYLSVAVRNRRRRLVTLTFVFAAGISVVLLPITLGIGTLSRSLQRYHGPLYGVGGSLLLLLAILAVTGKTWMLPMMRQGPDVSRTDSGSVFALGVFAGAASACCAPVLAGVVTLSAVSPSLLQGGAMGLAYVFGMVFPLVVLTAIWDRAGLADRPGLRGRLVRWRIGAQTFTTNTFDLVAAAMFGVMGGLLWVIAITGASTATGFQGDLTVWLEQRFAPIVDFLEPVPNAVIGLFLVMVALAAIFLTNRPRPRAESSQGSDHDDKPATQESATPV